MVHHSQRGVTGPVVCLERNLLWQPRLTAQLLPTRPLVRFFEKFESMATIAGVLGILTLAGAVIAFATGDRIAGIDCLVVSGLSFAVWGVTRRPTKPPPGSSL